MKIFRKLENMFAASAFAEAGEFDTAREMLKEPYEDGRAVKPDSDLMHTKAGNRGGVRPSSTNA